MLTNARKYKILIADDDHINLNILTSIFKNMYQLFVAKNGAQVLERAEKNLPDLILLDVMMPGMDGYETIVKLKNHEQLRDIPVIFLTARTEVADEEKGLQLGAADYISKPFNAAIVKARVKTHLKMANQRKLLEKIALLDGLTEIPNRRSFEHRFSQEWQRAVRNRTEISLIILDIDYFKQYNDNYGHSRGDDALRNVAQLLTQYLKRPADFAARIGGEEFAVLLPESQRDGALLLAESIRLGVENLCLEHGYSSISHFLTISLGGATMIPQVGTERNQLFDLADEMLYLAKNRGRNKTEWR